LQTNLDNLRNFYNKYKCEPTVSGNRENELELRYFIGDRRKDKNKGKLSEELEKKIMEAIPILRWNCTKEGHIVKINQICEFIEKYNEFPKYHGKRENENTLAEYLSDRRKDKKKGKLSIELENQLTSKLPGFNFITDKEKKANIHTNNINNLKDFYEKYNEKPRERGDRILEKFLAKYISHQRDNKKKGKLSAELEKQIKDSCPWIEL
jgi:sulfur relay (sulfurtransferase) DsrC/TusE family protein